MKRPVFRAIPVAAFGIPVTAMILAAPFAHAQTGIEDSCKAAGGQYTQSQVSAHFGQDPQSQETCCTGNKCHDAGLKTGSKGLPTAVKPPDCMPLA